ncbi:MAG: hypothetical protein ACREIT_00825, partial [Tepidisphaeraceae bacterium]
MSPDSLRALVTTGATLFACAAFLLAQTAPTTVPAPTTAPATSVVTTAPVADDPEIERLVARLSDDNWKARNAAQ